MKKIKEFLIYILNIEIMGFLFILMNYYISDSTNYLPSSFTSNKSIYTTIWLLVLVFLVIGIVQYYADKLYIKFKWQVATLFHYLLVVGSILGGFYYLQFIGNITNFISILISISVLYGVVWIYNFKKKAY